jgi:hypothetical protein
MKKIDAEIFENHGIDIPNYVLLTGTGITEPNNPRHHPLRILTPYKANPMSQPIIILKAERGIRYTFLFNTIDKKGEFTVERWQDPQFEKINQPDELKIYITHFLKSLLVYFYINFCPRTRSTLINLGISRDFLIKTIAGYENGFVP